MKTAQGAISVDVSQFNSGIDSAKSKLISLGSIVRGMGSVISKGLSAWDSLNDTAKRINNFQNDVNNLVEAYSKLRNISGTLTSAFDKFKATIMGTGGFLDKHLNTIEVLAKKLVSLAGSVATVYIYYKTFTTVLSVYAGVAKSVINVTTSMIGKMIDLAAKAKDAGVSVAKVVGKGIYAGFTAIGNVAKIAGAGILALGVALSGFAVFVANGVKGVFELGDGYKTLRDRTGASIPYIYALEKAFKANGVSAEMVGPALNNMQKALSGTNAEGEATNKWFGKLKLNVEDLQALSPDEQFKVIAKAIAGLESPAQRTAAAIGIFGKTGASMIGVFKEIDTIGAKIDPSAKVLEENADRFARISTRLKESGNFFKGFFIAIAGSIAPELERILNLMQGGDFMTGIGEKLGAQLKFGLDVFLGALEGNTVGETLKMSFDFALLYLKDLLARTFEFSSVLLAKFLEADVASGLIQGLGNAFMGALSMISGTLLKAFSAPLAFFSAGIITALQSAIQFFVDKFPKVAKLAGVDGFTAGSFSENYQDQKSAISGFADTTVTSGFDSIKEGIQSTIDNAVAGADILKNALKEFPPQSKEVQDALANVTANLQKTAEAGKTSGAFIGPMQPEPKGTSLIPSVQSSKTASDAVSSLQRIGGGGGSFGADPLLNVNQKQLDQSKMQTDILKNVDKKLDKRENKPQTATLG
jgi:hypothetical protein